ISNYNLCIYSLSFLHDPLPTSIYTLSLHDALPISPLVFLVRKNRLAVTTSTMLDLDAMPQRRPCCGVAALNTFWGERALIGLARSEEHTSELQSRVDLVCRLLLEKKKK